MGISIRKILKLLLYGFLFLVTFLVAWSAGNSRESKLSGLSLTQNAHADAPVGSNGGGCAGCAGCAGSSGGGSSEGSSGDGGGCEGSGSEGGGGEGGGGDGDG